MNNTDETILKQFTKELTTLHYAMTFGVFAVSFMIYFFVIKDGYISYSNTDDIFLFICPLLAIGGVFGGLYLYRKKVENIEGENGLEAKLAAFRAATIMKFALIEGPALICIIASMQTENLLYLIIALFLIAYLFSQKTSEGKIVEALGLNED